MVELELEADIYCAGFLTVLRSDSPKQLQNILFKCIWTFVIQILLIGLLIYSFTTKQKAGGGTE